MGLEEWLKKKVHDSFETAAYRFPDQIGFWTAWLNFAIAQVSYNDDGDWINHANYDAFILFRSSLDSLLNVFLTRASSIILACSFQFCMIVSVFA